MGPSRRIARIMGPALVGIGVTEGMNLAAFAGNPAPVVYLNGTLLFIAGVAVLQAHSRWRLGWPVLVTLVGWAALLGGLYRMIAPTGAQLAPGLGTDALLAALVAAGAVLVYQGYPPRRP